jgi:hypothetical protein
MFQFFFSRPVEQQVGRTLVRSSLFGGLLLIGFGMLVFILRDLFAFLAAAVFFIAGFSAIGYAIRTWIMLLKMKRSSNDGRENVTIHMDDPFNRP